MEKNDLTFTMPANFSYHEMSALTKKANEFLDSNPIGTLYLDCSEIVPLNSLAIGAMMAVRNRFKQKDREIILRNAGKDVIDTLKTAGLTGFFTVEAKSSKGLTDTQKAEVPVSFRLDFEVYKNVGIFKFGGSMLTPKDADMYFNMARKILADGYKMLLDMTDLVFIDSNCIAAMVKLHLEMKKHKGEIRICSAGELLKGLLDIQHLTSIIKLYPNRDEALKGWVN